MRRVVDSVVAISGLILLAPILLIIAVFIRLDSKGPILYTPLMIGQHGKPFSLLRFRTMAGQQVTRVGKLLRNYSLDHLPMLINILRGDLTLVGPRPMELHIVDFTDPIWQRYFQRKPGVINYAVLKLGKLWTPSRYINPVLNQQIELEYQARRSLKSDLRLLLDSLRAFMIRKGNIKARGEPARDVKDKISKVS
jgi:lipopolysaccharide/colanic/teichoic acid biosynthesis glycosyltransferase